MQDSMKYVLFPLPTELLEEANLTDGDAIQLTAEDGKLIVTRLTPEEADVLCDGNCKCCSCQDYCEECEAL